jgi:transcriptional regulator with XRE-family HTH domain
VGDGSSARLQAARLSAGLSIRALASRAGVASSTIWRIEAGRLDPTVGMLDRLLEAAAEEEGRHYEMTREEAVSLALGRLTAAWLLREPDQILAKARRRVADSLARGNVGSGQRKWSQEWSELLGGPLEDVVAALIDPGERGYELRQSTPFTGLIPEDERLEAVRKASRVHRAARSA